MFPSIERILPWPSSLAIDRLEAARFCTPEPTLFESGTVRISLLVRVVDGGGRFVDLVRLVDLALVTGVRPCRLVDRDLRFPDVGGGRLPDLPLTISPLWAVAVDRRVALVERVRLVDLPRLLLRSRGSACGVSDADLVRERPRREPELLSCFEFVLSIDFALSTDLPREADRARSADDDEESEDEAGFEAPWRPRPEVDSGADGVRAAGVGLLVCRGGRFLLEV